MDSGRTAPQLQIDVEVAGQEYKIHSFMPSKAFKLAVQLMKLVGEPFAAMAQGTVDEAKASDALQKAVSLLFKNMDADQVVSLVGALMGSVSQNGKPIAWELEFQGRLGDAIELLMKVMEYQFKDFTTALVRAIGAARGARQA